MNSFFRNVGCAFLYVSLATIAPLSVATAQDMDCAACHSDVEFASTAHPDFACTDCHSGITREHRRDGVDVKGDEICAACHRRTVRSVSRSVHENNAGCLDCHTEPHGIHKVDDMDAAISPVNQITTCGQCHSEPESLIAGYLGSVHGKGLFVSGLVASPTCSDCHGAHQILPVEDEKAPTSHANSPEMCGDCHTILLDEWKTGSAHGIAWAEGDDSAPVCNDCHSSHDIADPTRGEARLASTENCGDCHAEYLTTFRATFHGQANELGFMEGATCADCHSAHNNLPASDPRSSVHPDNVVEMCSTCHANVNANAASFNPHGDPTNPDDNFKVYVVWFFMTGLLIGVFSFFGIHDILWLQRSIVGALRGEFEAEKVKSGPWIRRFTNFNIYTHITIIVTFLLLALTGLPLKFSDQAWAQTLMGLLGGVDSSTYIHRLAAIGTFGYAAFHLGNLFYRFFIQRERGMLWGPYSMVPQPKDIKDILVNIRHFLYLGDRPKFDRWNYIEKFDYLAVFWGVMIIGLSGLFLWFPFFFTSFLPGWTINAAHIIHSDEALLATGFIFVFHFFHTHLRPESFPMDTVIFTGKMSLERFKHERPLEYERLVETGELENYIVEPPTEAEAKRAYFWGTIFLVIGVLLAIGIIWALLHGGLH